MDLRVKPFSYPLAAMLKKDRWEGQVLGAEAGVARRVVDECRKREQETLDLIASLEAELRGLCGDGQPIPLERRRILDLFLRHQYGVAALRRQEHAQAESVHAQVLQQLQAKHRSIKTMEQHQQRKRDEHDEAQTRAQLKAQDDSWLLRKRGGSGA